MIAVSIVALGVAIGAAMVALVSVLYVRRSTRAQEENLRLTKTPQLVAIPVPNTERNQTQWFYALRNDSLQDLDDVQMHLPEPRDSVALINALFIIGAAIVRRHRPGFGRAWSVCAKPLRR